MRRILVAIDGSKHSSRVIEYCGKQFSGMSDLSLTLFHVLPNLPARFWEEGHLLTKREMTARRVVADKWLINEKLATEPMFQSAIETLTRAGIPQEQIETKTIPDSTNEVTSILEEARDGGYLTLVLGRYGLSWVDEHVLGSTTIRIIHRGAGLAICVVE
ncbi:MAG: universal stress protein [Syntrophorhabdales bacterium]|jgi:nucleotide-binding universal stress UspA family protein